MQKRYGKVVVEFHLLLLLLLLLVVVVVIVVVVVVVVVLTSKLDKKLNNQSHVRSLYTGAISPRKFWTAQHVGIAVRMHEVNSRTVFEFYWIYSRLLNPQQTSIQEKLNMSNANFFEKKDTIRFCENVNFEML